MTMSKLFAVALAAALSSACGGNSGGSTEPRCQWNSSLAASSSDCKAPPPPPAPTIVLGNLPKTIYLGDSMAISYSAVGAKDCLVTTNDAPLFFFTFISGRVKDSTSFNPTYMAPTGIRAGGDASAVLTFTCTNASGVASSMSWTVLQLLPPIVVTSASIEHLVGLVNGCHLVVKGTGWTSHNGRDFNGTWGQEGWGNKVSPWFTVPFTSRTESNGDIPDWIEWIRFTNDTINGPFVKIRIADMQGSCIPLDAP